MIKSFHFAPPAEGPSGTELGPSAAELQTTEIKTNIKIQYLHRGAVWTSSSDIRTVIQSLNGSRTKHRTFQNFYTSFTVYLRLEL